MTSKALIAWRSDRLRRLDRLLLAHPEAGLSRADPAIAQEWTEALVLRLASEFQGFCRNLHDEAVVTIVTALVAHDSDLAELLIHGLVTGRGLDRRGADVKTIGDDFDRVGLELWASLAHGWPQSAASWRAELGLLHRARNGVVHDDRSAVQAVEFAGRPLRVETVLAWRNLLDEIAEAMDTVVHREITESLGMNP